MLQKSRPIPSNFVSPSHAPITISEKCQHHSGQSARRLRPVAAGQVKRHQRSFRFFLNGNSIKIPKADHDSVSHRLLFANDNNNTIIWLRWNGKKKTMFWKSLPGKSVIVEVI